MRLSVLVDNNTLIDRYFLGEPGLSFHVEDCGRNVLFDAGYSDAFLRNAPRMGIDLRQLNAVVLSHSHVDHSWGLAPLFRMFTESMIEGLACPRPEFVAHPEVFLSRHVDGLPEIGSFLQQDAVSRFCDMNLSREPVWLTDDLVFLGEIPRNNDFESLEPLGTVRYPDGERDCFVREDSAMACRTDDGLVVITGCSHAGICNIIEHARAVCGEQRVRDVIGGFHLQNPPERQMQGTMDYFEALRAERVFACHCTDLASKIRLARVANLCEAGVGLQLEY
jgi:7,8-dihydropterin-6-yl-methyl-4-(beta-D-ribofuranosyl)aminobenzene 5'-phosphate synthase